MKRLGLTMRVETDPAHGEGRDVLAHDWSRLISGALGDVPWLPIPNLGKEVTDFVECWKIDALILTGGNDIGSCPRRDRTEHLLLEYASRERIPVLGVCRGLQLLQTFHGGRLGPAPPGHADGSCHSLEVCHPLARRIYAEPVLKVNSFHRMAVFGDDLAADLEPFLVSEDGLVEGLLHRTGRQVAVQWHPERPLPDPRIGVRLIRAFFEDQF